MRRYKLSILFLILFSGDLFAQRDYLMEKTFPAYSEYLSNEFGIACKIPEKFANMNKYNVMWKVRKDKGKHAGNMYGVALISGNKECIVMYSASPWYISKGDMEMREKKALPIYPRSHITSELKTALGLYYSNGHPLNNDSAKFDFDDYVTIVAGKKAREMFNADSIYMYDVPGADSVYFIDQSLEKMHRKKYPCCTSVFINKSNRASMDFKLFFTKKGKKKEEKYIDMLSKQIWYEDNFENDKE